MDPMGIGMNSSIDPKIPAGHPMQGEKKLNGNPKMRSFLIYQKTHAVKKSTYRESGSESDHKC